MLADFAAAIAQTGTFGQHVQLPDTSLNNLLDFLANEVVAWRDDPFRPKKTSETALTDSLCDHLSSAARMSAGWDILQFRTEVEDEKYQGRKIDLAPKPCGVRIKIAGREYAMYDMLMPIECKRLPTPKGKDRDEREYVVTSSSTTGGIQRFKAGYHGSAHRIGAMIAYIQQESSNDWHKRVKKWISDLISERQPGWTSDDLLRIASIDKAKGLCIADSHHSRAGDLGEIALRHIWIEMQCA